MQCGSSESNGDHAGVITLGPSPHEQVRVTSTASAILLDTRNAYVYGLAEATSQQKRLTSSWQSSEAVDETRRAAESDAFDKLVGELERTWISVLSNHNLIQKQLSRN
jgi:hypothetical protein